ncbi:MAG TPA: MBOAT family O-acyltransferase [Gemmatimonadales bacterium]|nr:MBOAT family O-acyltransferase [Gemmatimonadales bacterium]
MLFNSAVFLFLFLPITYVVFWAVRTKNSRYIWLTLTGYVFYGYWNPAFCLLMLFSTLVSYLAGLGFLRWDGTRQRRLLLVIPVAADLALLAWFKYADFAIGTWNWASGFMGRAPLEPLNILLPIGISFYTFHTITYIVDAYRGTIRPTRNFWEFSCYVSLFSQLVAGPIVRFSELQADLEGIDHKDRRTYLDLGWSFFIIGMAQKVLLADTIASVIDPALEDVTTLSSASAWMCMLGYSYQLYFDFAGYSNMAVGLGYMFGMYIPQNFHSPYKALNPSDFWRRWHISLSRVLRDYLYIPLGGSKGSTWLTYRNLMITMLLGGLWHGAAWTFVIWGAYHGVLLSLYRRFGGAWDRLPELFQRAGMFLLVVIGWVFFRAPTVHDAVTLLRAMFIPEPGTWPIGAAVLAVMLLMAGTIAHLGPNTFEMRHQWKPAAAAGLAALLVLSLIRIYGADNSPFLYFQF